MIKSLLLIISIFLFHLLSSCLNNNKNFEKSDRSVVKDIPLDDKGENFFYSLFKKASTELNLADIDNGFDSLMLRIWYPERVQQYMVEIANTNGKWNAKLYVYEEENDGITNLQVRILKPKSGWAHFSQELFGLGITTLPDMENISNYPGIGADGNGYHVEVATLDKYRFYSHSDIIDLDIEEAQKMVKIMNLLNNEFGIEGNWF